MKRLFLGAVLAALCAVPTMSLADTQGAPWSIAAPGTREAPRKAWNGVERRSPDEASDYAAREAASPQLAQFAGGADGVYITTGALLVALIVVLILIAA